MTQEPKLAHESLLESRRAELRDLEQGDRRLSTATSIDNGRAPNPASTSAKDHSRRHPLPLPFG